MRVWSMGKLSEPSIGIRAEITTDPLLYGQVKQMSADPTWEFGD